MNNVEFISKLIDSLAWPFTVLLGLFFLRKPIRIIISSLKMFKYGEIEIKFSEGIRQLEKKVNSKIPSGENTQKISLLRDKVFEIIKISPKYAIIEVWNEIEVEIMRILTAKKIKIDPSIKKKPIKLAEKLFKENIIDKTQRDIIVEMRKLRNEAAHYEKAEITGEIALRYLDSGSKTMMSLNNK